MIKLSYSIRRQFLNSVEESNTHLGGALQPVCVDKPLLGESSDDWLLGAPFIRIAVLNGTQSKNSIAQAVYHCKRKAEIMA